MWVCQISAESQVIYMHSFKIIPFIPQSDSDITCQSYVRPPAWIKSRHPVCQMLLTFTVPLLFHLGDWRRAITTTMLLRGPLHAPMNGCTWEKKKKHAHAHTISYTYTHTHTAPRCFKSTRRIGYDYCGYRNCYHRLPSQPLSAVRSLQLSALFTLMWAVGNIAERRLP